MSTAALLRHGLRLLLPLVLPLALASTLWLYLYPFFQGCTFALPAPYSSRASYLDTLSRHIPFDTPHAPPTHPRAPFRLLALGDPQLEGSTSIPNVYLGVVPHLKSLAKHVTFRSKHASLRQRVRASLHDLVDFYVEDIPNELESIRKRIDLWGNDFYLAHIYRTLDWWAKPTHVTVLGDLVGSQWIDDKEFGRRVERFWGRVFKGAERVPDELALYPAEEYDLAGYLSHDIDCDEPTPAPSDGEPEVNTDEKKEKSASDPWRYRLLNVAGNHDIGYAGDLNTARIQRFTTAFGKPNYELRFELPVLSPALNATLFDELTNPTSTRLPPELRVVLLNDMNLDTPALSTPLQDETYAFLNNVINTASAVEFEGQFTVLLTHIPMFKPEGVCVDKPFFDFFSAGEGGGVKEQNMLSGDASRGFLEGMFGMSGNTNAAGNGKGRPGVVLNGHDHAGCDTYHFINQTQGTKSSERKWEVKTWNGAESEGVVGRPGHPGIREITVRSMMGDYHGNAGLLSAWFDEESWKWRYEYSECRLGTQHGWWAVHVIDLIAVVGVVLQAVMWVFGIGAEKNEKNKDAQGVKRASVEAKVEGKLSAGRTKEEM